jgi:hypothetical protein
MVETRSTLVSAQDSISNDASSSTVISGTQTVSDELFYAPHMSKMMFTLTKREEFSDWAQALKRTLQGLGLLSLANDGRYLISSNVSTAILRTLNGYDTPTAMWN